VETSEQANKAKDISSKTLSVSIPADLDKRLDLETIHGDMTKRAVVILALESYLQIAEAARA
jgi:hypothetical protein